MQIVIDKESLVKMLKVSLYAITGADYKDIGETVNELLDKVGYVELPKGHGRLIAADAIIDTLGCSDRDIYVKACIEEDVPTIIEADKAERSGEE